MNTTFENVTRRLDKNLATQDTTYDKSRLFGRDIKKIPYVVVVPTFSMVAGDVGISVPYSDHKFAGCMAIQYNYTAPRSFKFLKYKLDAAAPKTFRTPVVSVRYRVGTTVTRYKFPEFQYIDDYYDNINCAFYSGQLIQPNFCIEFWTGYTDNSFPLAFNKRRLTTNLLKVPSSVDEKEILIETVEIVPRLTLQKLMPETLPVVYGASSSWLTN